MKPEYKNLIPSKFARIVDEIEATIGSEIVVRQRCHDDIHLVADKTLAFCDCLTTETGITVTIAYPGEKIAPHVLLHEILHAHRNLVQKHPILKPGLEGSRHLDAIAYRIENDIEHLSIIPIEIAAYPDALDYWETHYSAKIDEIAHEINKSSEITPFDPIYEDLIRHWLIVNFVIPPGMTHSKLSRLLDQVQLGDQIREHASAIASAKGKAHRLALLLQAANHPTHCFSLWSQ